MKEEMAQSDDDDKTHTSENIAATHTDDTTEPTSDPAQSPSLEPAQSPSLEPAQSPSLEPTQSPSLEPAQSPSLESQSVVETPQTKSVGFSSDIDDGSDDDECGDIDDDIDDALDEGYMGMECTLERGFSLNESAIARDIRMEKYDEVAIKYQHTSSPSRYYPTFRHFKPLRKPPKSQHEMPVDKAGLYSFVMISWVTRLMWKAYKVGLKEEDIPLCSKYEMCDYNTDRLERLWHEEVKKKGKHKASFQHVLFKFYKTRVIFSSLLFAIMTILGIFGPMVFMRNLLVWLETEEPFTVGLYWAIGLILVEFARVILFCLVWSLNYRTGIRLRAACLGLLYRKLMRMSSLGNRSVGEIINLFANDSQRIFDFIVIGPMIIACPIVAVGGVIYILWLLGPWALFGMVAFVFFYPFQYILSRLMGYVRCKTVHVTDERVRMMNELLVCVKLIKMYAWEKSFAETISDIRKRERLLLEKAAYIQSISLAMSPTVPIVSAIFTFLAHIGAGYNLTAAQAWSYLGLSGHLQFSMDALTHTILPIREGTVSFKRLKAMSIVALFLRHVRASISQLRNTSRAFVEGETSIERLEAMSVMAYSLGRIRASMTLLTFTVRSIVEGQESIKRLEGMSVMAYFLGQIRASLNQLRYTMRGIVEGEDSLKRVESVLVMDELIPYRGTPQDPSVAVLFKDAVLAWNSVIIYKQPQEKSKTKKMKKAKRNDGDGDDNGVTVDPLLEPSTPQLQSVNALHHLNLTIKTGELIGVCGSVGAGKSSFISSILGHMKLNSGEVLVSGDCAYVGQQAWVLNDSLRENIIMDEPFDAKRYYRVINACSLTQDIEGMPAGDLTEIGERGINLSGGQKQRLSLARAVYSNRDIYLLDDPLSAVDAHVGRHIFQCVIKAALRDKTIIFVTHQLQYLPQCNRVVYIHEGKILGSAPHTNLLEESREYTALYNTHMDTVKCDQPTQRDKVPVAPQIKRIRQDSIMSSGSDRSSIYLNSSDKNLASDEDQQNGVCGQLITEEQVERGDIPYSTYQFYIKAAGGYFVSCLVILTFIINVGSTAISSWWLSIWLAAGSGNTTIIVANETVISDSIADNPDLQYYQTVYGCFIIVILITSLIRAYAYMKSTLKASSKMHDQVFRKVFGSPMSFFDTTPSGRIINLFSRDMDEVDVRVPFTMESFIQNVFVILSSLLFVCMVFPHFLPILLVLAIFFLLIRNIFRIGIRDFKRLENVSRSPLFSHISTTVNGLATINAYGKQKLFTKKFTVLFDENSGVYYLFNCAMRWTAVRLDLLSLIVSSCTAILTLVLRGSVEASFAGLALAYSAQLSGIFQFTVRLCAETEARFTSVERIGNCLKVLSSEAPAIIESKRPDTTWPKYGRISFRKVQMRYRPETPLVLKGITFDIDSMEKIGVVGRTGSGKSSLGVVLFRLVELTVGNIRIDGIDISSIGLDDLRSRLSIIPQDPVLFIGTVRYNLDPFDVHSDGEIWSALEQTYMKDRISNLEGGLSSPVVENGENFSVGERQLLCMARALLRHSKILFLDEATASIDTETDSKIQKTLMEAFKSCTMITIAHRLNTVMGCSRVLVMDDGKVAEFDTPATLMANPASQFAKMINKAESSLVL